MTDHTGLLLALLPIAAALALIAWRRARRARPTVPSRPADDRPVDTGRR